MRVIAGHAVAMAMLFGATAHATTIDVQGTLWPPACVVDNGAGGDIRVNFGDDININRLNGNNYRQVVSYNIHCGTDGQTWPLRLRFEGTANLWDTQALETSDPNLGIRFSLSGSDVSFGTHYPIPMISRPVLTAVPVRNSAAAPAEGVFTATANLLAEYY
jgi:type 1 fimbria pilin